VPRDRGETAVQLYHAGKVEQLLLSGNKSSPDYVAKVIT
jgi:vancomycin permeability regulator SanA